MPRRSILRKLINSIISASLFFFLISIINAQLKLPFLMKYFGEIQFFIAIITCLEIIHAIYLVKNTKILLKPEEIVICTGNLIKTTRIIPKNRVTIVKLKSTPISRLYHHADLTITSTVQSVDLPYLSYRGYAVIMGDLKRSTSLDGISYDSK